MIFEPQHEISNSVMCAKKAQTSLRIHVKLLTQHHLEFLRIKGGCIGSSESTRVKIPHCWKSHV